jgi:hypothetical protein
VGDKLCGPDPSILLECMRSGFSPESLARLPLNRYPLHAFDAVFVPGRERMPEAAHRHMLTWARGNTFPSSVAVC